MTTKIKGYRELTEEEIELINRVKSLGTQLEAAIDDIQLANLEPHAAQPQRWLAIGKTHLQQGLMALTRAIAKPELF